jgi:hypothetical protein
MTRPRPTLHDLLVLPVVLVAGCALWLVHAQAWDVGGRSPILNYDTAQYALAARELAWHGRLATPYALPVELQQHASPPWPLAAVQPGLVLWEGAMFKLVPARGRMGGSDPRAAITLLLPFTCFLLTAAGLALCVRHVAHRWWPGLPPPARAAASLLVAVTFLLDPEAQHFAVGGFTELPFTVGLLLAFFGLALEIPVERPLRYGIVLGLTGLFRANMLWLAPVFALAAAWIAPPGRRTRVLARVLAGFALPLLPWWWYKWRAFGSPGWDLTRFVVWDGIGGRTWFSLYHLPELPTLPHGLEAVRLVTGKVLGNLPVLLGDMGMGPRGLWIGGLAGALAIARPPRPLVATALAAFAAAVLGVLGAAASIPWQRYLFPTRILLEPIGLLALMALVARAPATTLSPVVRRALLVLVAAIALGWGAWATQQGLEEAATSSRERGVPATRTLTALSIVLNERMSPGQPLMSNLGPALAWQTNHPVVHLALEPEDVEACRQRLDFRHIVLAFREPRAAWGRWSEVVATQGGARALGLPVTREMRYVTADGFTIVWLELGPRSPSLAAAQ